MSATSASHSLSVKPPATSSSSSSFGSVASARASSSRLRSSSVSVPAGTLALSASPQRSSIARSAVDMPLAPARESAGDHQILEHRHAAERLRNLKRAGDAQPAALGRRQPRDVAALEQDASGIRRHRAGDDAEQRGLAGAVRPDDAERFAFGESKIEPVGDHDRAEPLTDTFERQDADTRPSMGSTKAATSACFVLSPPRRKIPLRRRRLSPGL